MVVIIDDAQDLAPTALTAIKGMVNLLGVTAGL